MTDCAHWIPVMLEQEKAEHEQERRSHVRDVNSAKMAINRIRAIINETDGELSSIAQPLVFEQLYNQALAGAMWSPQAAPPQQCRGGLFEGLFGSIWP